MYEIFFSLRYYNRCCFVLCLFACLFGSVDGVEGLAPHIPPDAELCFDLTLLGFKPRPSFIKPLIQELGLVMKPYEGSENIREVGVNFADDDDSLASNTVPDKDKDKKKSKKDKHNK